MRQALSYKHMGFYHQVPQPFPRLKDLPQPSKTMRSTPTFQKHLLRSTPSCWHGKILVKCASTRSPRRRLTGTEDTWPPCVSRWKKKGLTSYSGTTFRVIIRYWHDLFPLSNTGTTFFGGSDTGTTSAFSLRWHFFILPSPTWLPHVPLILSLSSLSSSLFLSWRCWRQESPPRRELSWSPALLPRGRSLASSSPARSAEGCLRSTAKTSY